MPGAYDINEIFAEMEQNLIASYKRNMARHTQEEIKEGFKWEMWQAQKIKDAQAYLKENRTIIDRATKRAKDAATGIIKDTYGNGQNDAEAILSRFKLNPGLGGFGIINRRKLDALIQASDGDMDKATQSILRMTDDAYRQVVFKSQVMYSAGATTLPKAIDMAAKTFLEAGINSVQYQNGNKVNVASYAEMAIRNSAKKAYLQGEGSKNAEWGVSLVQVTSYGACSSLCLPYQGKVYVDDVYSEGKSDGEHPLLSQAIEGGLYHPNCRHTQGAYFDGISYPPIEQDVAQVKENYAAEQKQRGIERNIRKYKRVAEGSIDPENQRKAQAKVKEWQSIMRQHLSDNPELSRKYSREKTYGIPPNPDKVADITPKFKPSSSVAEANKYAKDTFWG